jgi:hypothetical protein
MFAFVGIPRLARADELDKLNARPLEIQRKQDTVLRIASLMRLLIFAAAKRQSAVPAAMAHAQRHIQRAARRLLRRDERTEL